MNKFWFFGLHSLCELLVLSVFYVPCNRRSAGSLLAVESSRVRTVNIMLVLFLCCDVTTVSVDMDDVTGTSVISNPFWPLKIFWPFTSHHMITLTYVHVNFATPLSVGVHRLKRTGDICTYTMISTISNQVLSLCGLLISYSVSVFLFLNRNVLHMR